MPFVEDMPAFFADFGSAEATLGGDAVAGIFDAPHADPLGIATTDPTYVTTESARTVKGARLVIPAGQRGAGSWDVRIAEPDGTGMCTLILERAP